MGIPRFYGFITKTFPTVSEQISFKGGFNTHVDHLYLDANGIIHDCARQVYFPENDDAKRGTEKDLFNKIDDYMTQLLKFVKPQKTFYIAIDGPAPIAKQTQQRQRRYKSADEKTDESRRIFDSTAITPGTTFMSKLGSHLKSYVSRTSKKWKNIEIIFSDSDVPGEGEHKLVNFIRNLPTRVEDTHCMYGLDADLFMLSLSTHCPHFYLLREDQFNTKWNDTLFYKVDIGKLRRRMMKTWGSVFVCENRLVDDFIFLCFLTGNDFLHALPSCHDLAQSVTELMQFQKGFSGKYLTNGSDINLEMFATLLEKIVGRERESISVQYYKQNFPNLTLTSSLIDPRQPELGVSIDEYRRRYYKKAGIDSEDVEQVNKMCIEYIQGLDWVQHYYHNTPTNWRWFYPYHYTPLASDILRCLHTATTLLSRVSAIFARPLSPIQQLLFVVPPKSKKLLPVKYRSLYKGELSDYYPEKYEIDLEGKHREWEGIALLPFPDVEKIIAAAESV